MGMHYHNYVYGNATVRLTRLRTQRVC
jgi:hypothetical protein